MEKPPLKVHTWGEIAKLLGRSVRTVQRWERDERLPIQRLVHVRGTSVFVYQHELDAWIRAVSSKQAGLAPKDRTSIRLAVLDFSCVGLPKPKFVAAVLADDLSSKLSCVNGVEVVARSSVQVLPRKDLTIGDVGSVLKCEAVVEGTVRASGEGLEIVCNLVSCEHETIQWSVRRSGTLGALESTVTSVCDELVHWLKGNNGSSPGVRDRRIDADAYMSLMRARMLLDAGTPRAFDAAKLHLQDALTRSPALPEARGLLSIWHVQTGLSGAVPLRAALNSARREAEASLRGGQESAGAHIAAGWVAFSCLNPIEAEKHFRRALVLAPSSVEAHSRYARFLVCQRRTEEALAHARMAQRLDPLSRYVHINAGIVLYSAKLYRQALIEFRRALSFNPESPNTWVQLGVCYLGMGHYAQALRAAKRAARYGKNHVSILALAGCANALAGRGAQADNISTKLRLRCERSERKGSSNWIYFAMVSVCRKDYGAATRALQAALRLGDPELAGICAEPLFEPIRTRKSFKELISKIDLPL